MMGDREMSLTGRRANMITLWCSLLNLADTSMINELARIRELSSGDVPRNHRSQRKIVDEMRNPE